jgi:phage gpG-like protein
MIVAKFKFPHLEDKIKKNRHRIEMFIAATMQTNRALLFDSEGAANGHKKWATLKFRTGKPLLLRGTLRKSIGPTNDGKRPKQGPNGIVEYANGVVKIGTSLAYAAPQNFGAVVSAKKAKALKIPLGPGKYMFRKSVTIPARNFNSISPEDKQEFNEALAQVCAEVLRERK